jgi:hypothetical protein
VLHQILINDICDVIVSVLTSSVVDHGFKLWSGQNKYLGFYNSASSLIMTQQSVGRHVTPIQHIIQTTIEPVFLLFLLNAACVEKQQMTINSLWFDAIGVQTHDLPLYVVNLWNVSGPLFQWASTIKIQLSVLF